MPRLLDINYRTVLKDFKDESLRKIYDLKKQDKKVIISIENKEYFLENYFNTIQNICCLYIIQLEMLQIYVNLF